MRSTVPNSTHVKKQTKLIEVKMKAQIKLLLLTSIASLGITTFANASISVSMETVCKQANNQKLAVKATQLTATDNSSALLSQHFAVTTCNGKQLLEPTNLEQVKILSSKSVDNQLASSTD
ncbi:hypothetical protein [Alteromonas sp. M12]|uniref:hypothetical protein n=1 Tax=Alteromonas sp. M12 TaxID=3135644 RepID=UPI00319DCF3D